MFDREESDEWKRSETSSGETRSEEGKERKKKNQIKRCKARGSKKLEKKDIAMKENRRNKVEGEKREKRICNIVNEKPREKRKRRK